MAKSGKFLKIAPKLWLLLEERRPFPQNNWTWNFLLLFDVVFNLQIIRSSFFAGKRHAVATNVVTKLAEKHISRHL